MELYKLVTLVTLYKIIVEVLSGCIEGVHETIHLSSGTLVKGRQIIGIVLITNELMDKKSRLGEE